MSWCTKPQFVLSCFCQRNCFLWFAWSHVCKLSPKSMCHVYFFLLTDCLLCLVSFLNIYFCLSAAYMLNYLLTIRNIRTVMKTQSCPHVVTQQVWGHLCVNEWACFESKTSTSGHRSWFSSSTVLCVYENAGRSFCSSSRLVSGELKSHF